MRSRLLSLVERFLKRAKENMEKAGERLVIAIPSSDMERDMMRTGHCIT